MDPQKIFKEYQDGIAFKDGLGDKGLCRQSRINERFYAGDQWHGAQCGTDRPLVRHNVIRRIADYKMSMIGAGNVAVRFSAEGVPDTRELRADAEALRAMLATGRYRPDIAGGGELGAAEVNLVMGALGDYFKTTAERLQFPMLCDRVLRDAYCAGTGVLYTYWDEQVRTGLYADRERTEPIRGDIGAQVIDIENVFFGDPNLDDVQGQPYIILAQRLEVEDIKRMARRYHRPQRDIDAIVADTERGDFGIAQAQHTRKAVLLTRLWKEYAPDGSSWRIKGICTTEKAVVRPEWELGLQLYPLAKFSWQSRKHCAYGESEVTYLIPNQIAINRMLTASVWAVMMQGMPLLMVNGDVVGDTVTNDPGQVIKIYGGSEEMASAMRYLQPPAFAPALEGNIASMIDNTLRQAGATDAALGEVRPDNAAAIIAIREAATLPMQPVQNRYYAFCEQVARIWADFWVHMYGDRSLKISDGSGVWYLPFRAARYRDCAITAQVDVGASTLWSQAAGLQTLDNLLDKEILSVSEYLERLPHGLVPDVAGLVRARSNQKEVPPDDGSAGI